jgi:hypothetical protein
VIAAATVVLIAAVSSLLSSPTAPLHRTSIQGRPLHIRTSPLSGKGTVERVVPFPHREDAKLSGLGRPSWRGALAGGANPHVRLLFKRDDLAQNAINSEILLQGAMRMHPDIVILCELRGREAWSYVNDVIPPHPGSIALHPHGSRSRVTFQARSSTWTTSNCGDCATQLAPR